MKITLDLDALMAEGKLTAEEAGRLKLLARAETHGLATNILLGFGIVALTLGIWIFVPTAIGAIVLGLIVFGAGLALKFAAAATWDVFAQISLTMGAIGISGGLIGLFEGALWVECILVVGLASVAGLAQSGLLAALAVLLLDLVVGSSMTYFGAGYYFWTPHPALSIGVFSLLTLVLYLVSLRVPWAYERLLLIGARTAILIINLAFLTASLFGDADTKWPDLVFVVGWAVVLVAVGVWATQVNRRWVVNVAAVFGAIHFFTQWFERLGASPWSVLGGGLLLVAFGVTMTMLNRPKGPLLPRAAAAA